VSICVYLWRILFNFFVAFFAASREIFSSLPEEFAMSQRGPRTPQSRVPGRPAGRTRVRCLGPAPDEHTFLSASPAERICPRCRALQRAMHLSPLRIFAVAAPPE
jgi:hypothetical protein